MQAALKRSILLLLVVSPEAMSSPHVNDEWQYFKDQGKPVIPLLYEPTDAPFQLGRVQFVDFYKQSYDKAFAQLRHELQRHHIVLNSHTNPSARQNRASTKTTGNATVPIDRVVTVLTAYVELRSAGHPIADINTQLQAKIADLTQAELHDFVKRAKQWEINQPIQHIATGTPGNSPAGPAPASAPQGLVCPACQMDNPATALYCGQCGNPLPEQDTTHVFLPRTPGGKYRLALTISGAVLYVDFDEAIVLGRTRHDSPVLVQVDLTPFDGVRRGVSRRHATLRLQDGRLVIQDMRSTNGTYVNGRLLVPGMMHNLIDGDVLRLGNLEMRINFDSAK